MTGSDHLIRQRSLITALAASLEHQGGVTLFETHISWVLVCGEHAYKFKKAVRFDFLDFSTLAARQFYCQEEVRLNSRLAPDIYLCVVPVGGSIEHPVLGHAVAPIEYCVKMRAFPQQSLWHYRLQQGLLGGDEIDGLAHEAARFHGAAARAPQSAAWGSPVVLQEVAHDNYAQIAATPGERVRQLVATLQSWGMAQQQRLEPVFAWRLQHGHIRECHGDLHSGNILTLNGKVQVFDCIEFNESLRWIDVINDIAFIYMDLQFQGWRELAARCLNRYLEITGDYEGVRVLRYYQVQRALVRSKVALLRARQAKPGAADAAAQREGLAYLEYAAASIAAPATAIMITHGFSGSGKSVFARQVVECLGALQLRSDVERKRLLLDASVGKGPAAIGAGLYDPTATQRTYQRLLALVRLLVESGMPVIVDAAFLRREQRRQFSGLAGMLGVPFVIFDIHASEPTMRARVTQRQQLGADPSDAGAEVLAHQLRNHDPLSGEELAHVIPVDAEADIDGETVQGLCRQVFNQPLPASPSARG